MQQIQQTKCAVKYVNYSNKQITMTKLQITFFCRVVHFCATVFAVIWAFCDKRIFEKGALNRLNFRLNDSRTCSGGEIQLIHEKCNRQISKTFVPSPRSLFSTTTFLPSVSFWSFTFVLHFPRYLLPRPITNVMKQPCYPYTITTGLSTIYSGANSQPQSNNHDQERQNILSELAE